MDSPRELLLGRVAAAWAEFSTRADSVARDDWGRETSSGWSVRAMLAHVAAWHDVTTFRLHRFVATGRPQPKVEPDDDRFNARVAVETSERSPEQVRRSLHTSYERLRLAIASTPANLDPDGWIAAVVAGNTYGHYEEHLPELEALIGT